MAVVARVLLDHVDVDPAQIAAMAISRRAGTRRPMIGATRDNPRTTSTSARTLAKSSSAVAAVASSNSASGASARE